MNKLLKTALLTGCAITSAFAQMGGQMKYDTRLGLLTQINSCQGRNGFKIGALQIKVKAQAALLDRLSVRFASGETQTFAFQRGVFSPGEETRVIDLAGGQRCVDSLIVHGQNAYPRQPSLITVKALQLSPDQGPGQPGRTVSTGIIGRTSLMTTSRDFDWIPVQECRLDAIRLSLSGSPAIIDFIKVKFQNGESQNVASSLRVDQGQSSDLIDLKGNNRCVTGIQVQGKSLGRFQAAVTIEGFNYLNN